jgi:hypothetical protein
LREVTVAPVDVIDPKLSVDVRAGTKPNGETVPPRFSVVIAEWHCQYCGRRWRQEFGLLEAMEAKGVPSGQKAPNLLP